MEELALDERRGTSSTVIRGEKVGADARNFKSMVEKRLNGRKLLKEW